MSLTRLLCLSLVVALVSASPPYLPEPRPETWWQDRHHSLVNYTQHHASEIKVVFLGDSITEGWAGNGKATWDAYYASRNASNYGIGGDRTEHILWRIENGEFEKLTPKLVVLMIGTNNLSYGHSPADIAKGIKAILQKLSEKVSHVKILLLSVLPRIPADLDTKVHEVNKLISVFADNKAVFYHDLTSTYEVGLGKQVDNQFVPDHVHLSAVGYKTWYKQIESTFIKLIN